MAEQRSWSRKGDRRRDDSQLVSPAPRVEDRRVFESRPGAEFRQRAPWFRGREGQGQQSDRERGTLEDRGVEEVEEEGGKPDEGAEKCFFCFEKREQRKVDVSEQRSGRERERSRSLCVSFSFSRCLGEGRGRFGGIERGKERDNNKRSRSRSKSKISAKKSNHLHLNSRRVFSSQTLLPFATRRQGASVSGGKHRAIYLKNAVLVATATSDSDAELVGGARTSA